MNIPLSYSINVKIKPCRVVKKSYFASPSQVQSHFVCDQVKSQATYILTIAHEIGGRGGGADVSMGGSLRRLLHLLFRSTPDFGNTNGMEQNTIT